MQLVSTVRTNEELGPHESINSKPLLTNKKNRSNKIQPATETPALATAD